MRTSGRRLLVLGAAAGLALVLAGAAPTASDPPPAQVFAVSYHDETGTGIAFGVATAGEGPAMAKTTFYVPAGYGLDLARAPGSVIGETYAAILTSNGFTSGEGTLRTGDPATLPGDPAAQACAPGRHSAVWIASYKAGTRAGVVRFYVDATAGAETPLGAFKLVACFDSPDATPEGPYFLEFELDILSPVLRAPPVGTYTWRVLVTPYVDGTTNPDSAKTFEARARVLVPHLLTERARYLSRSRQLVVTGRLLARGQPRRRVSVWLAAGPHKGALRLVGRVHTRADGRYSFRMPLREGRRPRVVDVVAFRIESPGLCVAPSTAPAGCVDERVSPPAPHLVQVRIPKLPKRR